MFGKVNNFAMYMRKLSQIEETKMGTKRMLLSFLFLLVFLLNYINAQDIGPGSRSNEHGKQETAMKKVEDCLEKIEGWKRDFIILREIFAQQSQIYNLYSRRALISKVLSQFTGILSAAYLNNEKVENAPWIIWGISGGLPLVIETIEHFSGDWKKKSRIYHEMSIETGELIRRIEKEVMTIRQFTPSDTLRCLNFFDEVRISLDEITKKVPQTMIEKDAPEVKNIELLPSQDPRIKITTPIAPF